MDAPDVKTAETDDGRVPAHRRQDQSGAEAAAPDSAAKKSKLREIGGPQGPEPTRYGDWERAGRCIDF
ncbi:MAG: DUF1674 domain-containing protein [Gammaproteobacteria bacterium]|nr:DUF1674 domain-containing protein [Gammaproteobacteria bacterium]